MTKQGVFTIALLGTILLVVIGFPIIASVTAAVAGLTFFYLGVDRR